MPDTEISLFTDVSGLWVDAILIQSPEPLPWRRIWQWIRLTDAANANLALFVLWNADGTIGLLVPQAQTRGAYNLSISFQGNLGAEGPCITLNGAGVNEIVAVGPIVMGPLFKRPGGIQFEPPVRPALNLTPGLKAILRV
jgi:hypothetical protein